MTQGKAADSRLATSCKASAFPVGVAAISVVSPFWVERGRMLRRFSRTYFASLFFAAIASIGWVFAAVLIALSDEIYNFTLIGGLQNFFDEFNYVFICILLLGDLAIGLVLLEDTRMKNGMSTRKFSLATAGIIIILLVLLPYISNKTFFNENILLFFLLSLIPLIIVRFCSYAGHRTARSVHGIRDLGAQANAAEGS
jgi:hypothetical protein